VTGKVPKNLRTWWNAHFEQLETFANLLNIGILFYLEPRIENKDIYLTAYLMDGDVVLNFKRPKTRADSKGLMTNKPDDEKYSDGMFHKVCHCTLGQTKQMEKFIPIFPIILFISVRGS
jgi:hypothetical protein